ncbi:MAG TPA: hypothetical protein VL359_12930 [bacterium]|nr:hypothetical protein [bacterium]
MLLCAILGVVAPDSPARAQSLQQALDTVTSAMAQKLAAQAPVSVAVADLPGLQGSVCDLGRFVAERLTTELAAAQVNTKPAAKVLERGLLAQALGEMSLTALDLADPEHAKQAGLRVGAEMLVLGALSDLGQTLELDVRLVRVAGAETLYSGFTSFAKTQPLDAMQRQDCAAGPGGLPAPAVIAAAAAEDGFIPQQARYENDAYRLQFEAARRADNTLTLVVVADNLTDKPFRLALRGFSYLLDEHGERWDQASADTAGYWSWGRRFDLVDLIPGTRRRTRLVFKPDGETNGTRFTLVAREYLPQDGRYVTVPDLLVPLVPGGPVAPPSQPAQAGPAPGAPGRVPAAPPPRAAPGAKAPAVRAPAPSAVPAAPAAARQGTPAAAPPAAQPAPPGSAPAAEAVAPGGSPAAQPQPAAATPALPPAAGTVPGAAPVAPAPAGSPAPENGPGAPNAPQLTPSGAVPPSGAPPAAQP